MSTPDAALVAAAAAASEARWADAAASLIAAWHVVRCGRIARLLATVDTRLPAPAPLATKTVREREEWWHTLVTGADEDMLRRLLAVEWPAHPKQAHARVDALEPHASPRISTELLALHRRAKYTSAAGNRLSRAIFHQLIDKDDHAVVEALDELRGNTYEMHRLGAAVYSRKRPQPPVFSQTAEAALDQIEKLMGRGGSSAREQLLAAVYEAPHEDGPRIVYADVLSEAGDPRGEFITLQLHRDGSIVTRRELQLLKENGRQWYDGIDNDGATEIELARGFPVAAKLTGGELRAPAWATIEKLVLHGTVPVRGMHKLRALKALHNLRGRHISQVELPLYELEYLSVMDYEDGLDIETPLAPRVLGLSNPNLADRVLAAAARIPSLPIGRRVETMQLGLVMGELARVIALVEKSGVAIEIAGWWNIEKPHHWTARVTKQRLHLHWTGKEAYANLAYDTLHGILAAIPRIHCDAVAITGIRDDGEKLERSIRRWNVKDLQIGPDRTPNGASEASAGGDVPAAEKNRLGRGGDSC